MSAIRADPGASPFTGEGHRKVWAWLRIQRGMRVGRSRVLRLIAEGVAIHGRRFHNLEEVRAALTGFAHRYNRH